MNRLKLFFIGLFVTFCGLSLVVLCAVGIALLFNTLGGLWAITIIILVASIGVGIACAISGEVF